MRILVIRLSSMGDVVMASVVFDYLRHRHPQAQIDFVAGAPYVGLFEGDPRLDRVVPYDRNNPGLACDTVRGASYDLAVDLQSNARSRRLMEACGCSTKRRFRKCRGARTLLLTTRISIYHPRNHVINRYLLTAGWDGQGELQWRPRITRPLDTPQVTALDAGSDEGLSPVGLVPFSAWRNKQWPVESFGTVAAALVATGRSVIVFGGPGDTGAAESLAKSVGEGCVSVAGKLPLHESAALLADCAAVLGNDTGLTHLARAVGTPAAFVYGSTTWHFGFQPVGEPQFRILEEPLVCRPCNAHGGNVCVRGGRPCLTRVIPERAFAAVEELLHNTEISASGGTTDES